MPVALGADEVLLRIGDAGAPLPTALRSAASTERTVVELPPQVWQDALAAARVTR